jgi:dihydrodipicolinate synthase/N-acetylneuraminate lyase
MVMPRPDPHGYEVKFAEFIRMCEDAKKSGAQTVLVAHPSVIGDNYEEIIESLSRLAKAGLSLSIAEPEQPAKDR